MTNCVDKYHIQIAQDYYEELLERDAWLTAIEEAFQKLDGGVYSGDFILEVALDIFNKKNEVAKEPVHLRLIRNMEGEAPSSVNND